MATETELRRRTRKLDAEDDSFSNGGVQNEGDAEGSNQGPPLHIELESDSESSDPDSLGPNMREPKLKEPVRPPSLPSRSRSRRSSSRSQPAPSPKASRNRTSWYEFDLSVVVALVSPIGNWLTGGDHVKNVLLLLLLIFYLHQIIEVPWNLYNLSRPRRPAPPHIPHPSLAEDRYKAAASSELQSIELLFLALTVISPLVGAYILRYVAATLLGKDAISWFSTSLFVLATGIRPWKHLVERFQHRITDLHDVIHYPPLSLTASEDAQAKVDELQRRVDYFEKALGQIQGKVTDVTEEVYDYVDEAMDGVEKVIRRHEKKCDVSRASQEQQLAAVEKSVESWRRAKGALSTESIASGSRHMQNPTPESGLFNWLLSLIPFASYIIPARAPQGLRLPSGTTRSPKSPKHRRIYASRMETIPEDIDIPYVDQSPPQSPTSANPPAPLSRPPPFFRIPGVNLALKCGDLATLPARTVVNYLLSARLGSSTLPTS